MAFLRRLFSPPKRKKNKSQIAVIITFIIAVMLLLSFVFINVARVSDIKASTGMAADKGALSIGTTLTVMVKSYLQMVNGNDTDTALKKCTFNWGFFFGILLIIVGLAIGFFTAGLAWAVVAGVVIGFGASFTIVEVNAYLKAGLAQSLTSMTAYSSTRETALLGMAQGVPITDQVRVFGGGGVYTDRSTGITFDLTHSPLAGLLKRTNPPTIPRFIAWYYAKRLPLVSEESLAVPIQEFIEYLMSLMYFKDEGDWNEKLWRYDRLTLAVEVPEEHITCDICGDCAPLREGDKAWLTKEELKVAFVGPIKFEDAKTSLESIIESVEKFLFGESFGIPGFLMSRFPDLCHKIISTFEDPNILVYGDPGAGEYISRLGVVFDDTPIHSVAADLKLFIGHVMMLANMPISERIPNLNSWLKLWFDFDQHAISGEQIGLTPAGSTESNFDSLGHDEYQRMFRVTEQLRAWKELLEEINAGAIAKIEAPMLDSGEEPICEQGQGELKEYCFTELEECGCCGDEDCDCCGEMCINEQPARWYGAYGTCTGSGFDHSQHPVCRADAVGDLYRTQPCDEWCAELREPVPCVQTDTCCGSCEIPPTRTNQPSDEAFQAFHFQGQMSHLSEEGMTEIAQAIEILDKVYWMLRGVFQEIGIIGKKAYEVIHENEETKNELVYVWNDVYPGTTEDNGEYHMVRAKIEGYPKYEEFPAIIQTREWANFWICKELVGKIRGSFIVSASRYDTDQESLWWNFRRRKPTVAGPQNLRGVENQIMSSGEVAAVDDCVAAGFESKAGGSYGINKEEITLHRLK